MSFGQLVRYLLPFIYSYQSFFIDWLDIYKTVILYFRKLEIQVAMRPKFLAPAEGWWPSTTSW